MLFMEKTMEQIYRKEFPHGSHSVYGEYGINRDLVLSSYHYGSDVEDFWGNDEIGRASCRERVSTSV